MTGTMQERFAQLGQLMGRHRASAAVMQAGMGIFSFILCMYLICAFGKSDPELAEEYRQVPQEAYQWPMVAFGTAFMINIVTLVLECEPSKQQLALLSCYINLLACTNDFLSWRGVQPVMRDIWGQGVNPCRLVMWLHTTPVMVYLLSMLSNFKRSQVLLTMAVDVAMIASGTIGQLVFDPVLGVVLNTTSVLCFCFVMKQMWDMFSTTLADAHNNTSIHSVKVVRVFTLGLWIMFPVVYLLVKLLPISIRTEEWMWTVCDFFGKVLYSSSLMQGNMLTMDQRKSLARQMVEEANRVKVIEELRDMVEHKERFLSGMSHELRTPLNGIIGLSEAMLVGSCGAISDQLAKTITTIKNSGARLLNLINDILDAASMKQSKGILVVKQQKVFLDRVVDDVLELCQPLARRGVRLVSSIPASIPPVLADNDRLIQIFHNLVGNACKFTHGGCITVSAAMRDGDVEVAVADSGIGIPSHKFDSIFQPFEQVGMSTTRQYGGTGLGLALVKQLVEAHGSAIHVSSQVGVGSTFFFNLKVWDAASSSGAGKALPSLGEPTHTISHNTIQQSTLADITATASVAAPSTPHAGNASDSTNQVAHVSGSTLSRRRTASSGLQPGAPASPLKLSARRFPSDPHLSGNGGGNAAGKGVFAREGSPLSSMSGAGVGSIVVPAGGSPGRSVPSEVPGVEMKDVFLPASVGVKIEVLSVDDDPVNQMVISNLLGPAGYIIHQAMHGPEALDFIRGRSSMPDIILLDVMMPGMSGYEVCRTLRQQYPDSVVPIIMVSAKSKEEDIVEGLAAGANDYVVKPFGRNEILARIATHLRVHSSEQGKGIAPVWKGGPERGHAKALDGLSTALCAPRQSTTLPRAVKDRLKSGHATATIMFDKVTLVVWQVTNLDDLAVSLPGADLVAALSGLLSTVDDLLEKYHMYSPDDTMQRTNVAAAGLSDEDAADQADQALCFARDLVEVCNTEQLLPGHSRFQISVGIHTMPAQGVLVGTNWPAMHVIGQILGVAWKLLITAAPGCVHVSGKTRAVASPDFAAQLSQASSVAGEVSYLLHVGPWSTSVSAVAAACTKSKDLKLDAMQGSATRMLPIQRALVALATTCPASVVELQGLQHQQHTHTGSSSTNTGSAGTDVGGEGRHSGPGKDAGFEGHADNASEEMDMLRHTNSSLMQQLHAAREQQATLQTEVEALEVKLKVTEAALKLAQESGNTTGGEVEQALRRQISDLEAQVASAQGELRVTLLQAADAKRALAATTGTMLTSTGYDIHTLLSLKSGAATSTLNPSRSTAGAVDDGGVSTPSAITGYGVRSGGGNGIGNAPYSSLGGARSSVAGSPGPLAPTMNLSAAAATDISVLLGDLSLAQLVPKFQEEQITPELLPCLDDAGLRELGVASMGARIKLRMAGKALFGGM